jgi:hypothetical protein
VKMRVVWSLSGKDIGQEVCLRHPEARTTAAGECAGCYAEKLPKMTTAKERKTSGSKESRSVSNHDR